MQLNNNSSDNVYGAVIVAKPLQEFVWFIWWMQTGCQVASNPLTNKPESCYQSTQPRSILQSHRRWHTQPFYGSLHFVRDNPGELVQEETFTHSHSSWSSIIPICFLHLLRSMASSLFNPHALQSFSTISVRVFFGLPLGLAPSTSYSIHFFTQSLSSFRNTCPYHRNLEDGRLSEPSHCNKAVQPMPRAVYHTDCHDIHNCQQTFEAGCSVYCLLYS